MNILQKLLSIEINVKLQCILVYNNNYTIIIQKLIKWLIQSLQHQL